MRADRIWGVSPKQKSLDIDCALRSKLRSGAGRGTPRSGGIGVSGSTTCSNAARKTTPDQVAKRGSGA